MGQFANNMSWAMVGTFLALFYTDVVGLTPAAVATIFLIAKIWDGINDPMMGAIMERTHTRWGRFRPYILWGAIALSIFNVLAFTVPGFGPSGKFVYAFITYVGLTMAFTMLNVPFCAMPMVMTRDPEKMNKLNAANNFGMCVAVVILNSFTLPLVKLMGGGVDRNGYQRTVILYSIVALIVIIPFVVMVKENITTRREDQCTIKEGIIGIITNRNLVLYLTYWFFFIGGMMGRTAVGVYFYINNVQNFPLIPVFMMMQMGIGILVMPIGPTIVRKIGRKNNLLLGASFSVIAMGMMFFGPHKNIPYLFVAHVIYGLGMIGSVSGAGMLIDAIDEQDMKRGVRPDGMAYSLNTLVNKIGTAIIVALFMLILGAYGYIGGGEVTSRVRTGINIVANLGPMLCYAISIVPILFYNLNEEKMIGIKAKLAERNASRTALTDGSV
jgi:sugar (glycoside-pentoside-hexuronide) transporter